MSYHQDPNRYSQPGLEVAPPSDPEVVPVEAYSYPIPTSQPVIIPYKADNSPYTASPQSPESTAYTSNTYNGEKGGFEPVQNGDRSKRKLYILIGVLAAIAVIVGAVVGGVVGSRGSSNIESKAASSSPPESPESAESGSPPSPSSTAAPKVNTTAVRASTRLSITGRRIAGDGFASRLFWQGGDDKIRTSRYTSTGGKWSKPLVFDKLDAKPGTPIAATIYVVFPQFEVFYLDTASTFRGINFGEDETVPKTDSVETDRPAFELESYSRMSAYFPYVIYQDTNLTFRREVYDARGRGWFNDTMQGWFNPEVMPLGDKGTGMAVVPVVKEFKGPYAAGIAYRGQDGRLAIFSFGGDDTDVAWQSATPKVSIPEGTAIGAFAVGRANSNTINTWILYQDVDNKIQAVWQDDDNTWNGPQEVGEADAGTDIACLTEQTGDQPQQILLSEQTDMARCYYQSGGVIKEKRLAPSSWIDGDDIPME